MFGEHGRKHARDNVAKLMPSHVTLSSRPASDVSHLPHSVWGYWINFATVGIADTGFIFFVLVPGYAPVWPGILGPVFWVLAMIFSTIALLTRGSVRSGTVL